jgi:hypothetical protein
MNDGSGKHPSSIILISPHPSQVRRLRAGARGEHISGWMYLGSDPVAAARMQEAFGPSIARVDITATLQDVARRYRAAYIDFIGGLSKEPCSLPWLLTSLSEKNPFASSFYLSFCSIAACMEHLEQAEGTVAVVCGSPGIQQTLAGNLARRGHGNIQCCGRFPPQFLVRLRAWLQGAIHHAWFAVRYLGRILLAHIHHLLRERTGGHSPGTVYLHAWTDARSFRIPGSFWDIFYGDLVPIISPVAPVCYIVDVLPTIGYLPALLRLRRVRNLGYELQEHFLCPADILRAIRAASCSYACLGTVPALDGIRVDPLISEEITADTASARGAQSYLCYLAGRHLASENPMAAFIYTFENQMWEKCSLAGIREVQPGARTVGYAHAIVNPNNLSYSYSLRERACTPLPDVILANGERPRHVLSSAGFPMDRIHVSGALRYDGITAPPGPNRSSRGRVIVLAGSVSITRTIELVSKAIRAFRDDPDLTVRIKCHPNLPFSYLEALVPPLPPHFGISEEPVNELLDSAGLLLYTESTVAVEAAARGIPVIHVKSDCSIDINIFEDCSLVPSVRSPEELRAAARHLLDHPWGDCRAVRDYITGLFGPVNPALIRSLVLPDGSAVNPPDRAPSGP